MNKELFSVNIEGEVYNYIQDQNESSVDGFIVKIKDNQKELVNESTGFYRQLLTKAMETENLREIIVLTVTSKGMVPLTGIFSTDGDKIDFILTKEPNIGQYIANYLGDKGIQSEKINSLQFIKENKDTPYSELLKFYYNPKSVDDTGFELNGSPIKYGEIVLIDNVQSLIQQHENLQGGKLDKLNVNQIKLTLYKDGPKLSASIGAGLLIDENGETVSSLKYYCIDEIEGDYETFKQQCELEDLYIFALDANKQIDQRPHKKESIIADCVRLVENEMKENNEPYKENIGVGFLMEALKNNLVTKGE